MLLRYCYVIFLLFNACAINAQSSPLVVKEPRISKYLQTNKNFSILPSDSLLLKNPYIQHIQRKNIEELKLTQHVQPNKHRKENRILYSTVAQLGTIGVLSFSSTFAHELGHYCTFNFFYPELAKGISVNKSCLNPLNFFSIGTLGYVPLDGEKNLSKTAPFSTQDNYKLASGFIAGPLSGLAFNTACLASINVYQNYKKEKNVKNGSKPAKKNLLGYDEFFVYKAALAFDSIRHLTNLIPNENDGYKALKILKADESAIRKIASSSDYLIMGLELSVALYLGINLGIALGKYISYCRNYSLSKRKTTFDPTTPLI